MLDKTLDSKQKTPNLLTNKNYLMIGQKVYKSESNNLIMFIAVSLVLGLSLSVLVLVFYLSYLSLLCINIFLLNHNTHIDIKSLSCTHYA